MKFAVTTIQEDAIVIASLNKYFQKFHLSNSQIKDEIFETLSNIFFEIDIRFKSVWYDKCYYAESTWNVKLITSRIYKKCFIETTCTLSVLKK